MEVSGYSQPLGMDAHLVFRRSEARLNSAEIREYQLPLLVFPAQIRVRKTRQKFDSVDFRVKATSRL